MADWAKRGSGGDGKGLGIAFARYKNMAAYSAVAVAVTVAEEVRLDHIWSASDAGLVINPDGALNQLEGGIVQAASFALKEQVKIEGDGIASRDWDAYPILRFNEVPPVDVELIRSTEDPPLGMGECTVGPTCAAIGNAVAHALGGRHAQCAAAARAARARHVTRTVHLSHRACDGCRLQALNEHDIFSRLQLVELLQPNPST